MSSIPENDPQVTDPDAPLTDHAYDGIREYDNPMPGWWVWLFVATVVFSITYYFVATLAGSKQFSPVASYDAAVVDAMRKGGGPLAHEAATLVRLSRDDTFLSQGSAIYQTNCVSCHGRAAEGITGPNLTDDHYINVRVVEDFYDVIRNGRNNGAMPSWANRLQPNEMVLVAAYSASLRGKNVSGGKAPEPSSIVPEPWKGE